jgi:alpha-ketoglutarate-dependent 2,4-dichlorophenoxyacetate dioxygenase
MSFTVHPVTPTFAAEIGDLDLSAPLDDAVIAGLEDAFNAYSVLIFPDQELSEAAQLAFSARFGPLETTIQKFRPGVKLRLDPQFADVSNIGADDKVLPEDSERRLFNSGNRLWHTDSSFRPLPSKCSLLYCL